jgi:hypothetical protein
MKDDSDLEDYNLRVNDGILPRTPAEEVRMVDNTGDQDRTAWELSRDNKNETHSNTLRLEEEMIEEGLRLRKLVCRDLVQSHKSISMQAATRSLAEILQLVPEEDARQVSQFQGLVYMPEHFLEKYLLPTLQLRRTLEREDEDKNEEFDSLPGGPETAVMYALFRHTHPEIWSK